MLVKGIIATKRRIDHHRLREEPWQTQRESSQRRLFDPDLPSHPWDDCSVRLGKSGNREAALRVLRLEEVRQVSQLVGCSKWSPETG